ncbi:MAG: SRPBCC domain-containing protein [Actinomycetes bacterium]
MSSTQQGTMAPIRRQVVVSANADRAFTAWTEELAGWWPFERHSVFGAHSSAAFVDGRLVETGPDGSQQLWGTVTTWEPGQQLSMTWHPGQDEDSATTVDVRFDAISDDRTLVTLTHTGWENRANATEARDEYGRGWPTVVGQFAARLDAASGSEASTNHGATWLVLQHSAVPGTEGSVFASPLFREHIAFLARLNDRGWLVAAGNLPDSPGSGMAILRVNEKDAHMAVIAAQEDDQSVTKGLFEVCVRPWNVALSGVTLAGSPTRGEVDASLG